MLNKQTFSEIPFYDHDRSVDFHKKDMNDSIYDALNTCKQMSLNLRNLGYVIEIDGLKSMQNIVDKIVSDLVDIHADLANQIRPKPDDADNDDSKITVNWSVGVGDSEVGSIDTTVGALRKKGVRIVGP
jgi:hypothetical protein